MSGSVSGRTRASTSPQQLATLTTGNIRLQKIAQQEYGFSETNTVTVTGDRIGTENDIKNEYWTNSNIDHYLVSRSQ